MIEHHNAKICVLGIGRLVLIEKNIVAIVYINIT